ncbi:type I methionyl aminopeptidase [Candidatus Gracilibacteria bacterium CG2_30_37_12]|nr:MAG: type I methionyl aminopeptidase [Candidatus Gracilibacteria bacterium CG2_30_37_12]
MAKAPKIIIKNAEQIEGIRKSSRLAASVLKMIEPYIKPGISTEELDQICNTYILNHGGISACIGYHGFPRYTCISINDVICHGIPSKKEILKEGDIVNVDVTTIVDGYFGDTSRMFAVGKISKEREKLIDMARTCLEIGLKEVYPGNRFGNIGYEIARHAERYGYSVVREYTGHGVGVYFHEEPYVYHKAPKDSGDLIEPGMIFTIEPMINIGAHQTKLLPDKWTVKTKDGSDSAQFEHTILVTESGYELLTVA